MNVNFDPQDKLSVATRFKVMIAGMNCKLVEGSSFHSRLIDLTNWFLITHLESNSSFSAAFDRVINGYSGVDQVALFRSIGHGLSHELTSDINRPVTVEKVDVFRDVLTFNEIKFGILLHVDQDFIDRYDEIQRAEMFEQLKRDLQR